MQAGSRWSRGGTLAVLAVLSLGIATPQQQPVFQARVELVTLDIAVVDEDGVPIEGLSPSEFRIIEDGVEREASVLLPATENPLDIALVVDLSGSMSGRPWREHSKELLEALSPRDCVFLVGFSSVVGGHVWGRANDPRLLDSLDTAWASGGTAIYDAMVFAAAQLASGAVRDLRRGFDIVPRDIELTGRERHAGDNSNSGCPVLDIPSANDPTSHRRKAMVMVTDGVATRGEFSARDALLAARAARVPVFTVGHQYMFRSALPSRDRLTGGRRRAIHEIARSTGGKNVRADEEGFRELINRLRGTYVMGYYTPLAGGVSSPEEFTRREIEIRVERQNATVIHPPVLYVANFDRSRARQNTAAGRRMLKEGETNEAILALDAATGADPNYASAYYKRARLFAMQGRTSEALGDAVQAASLEPGVGTHHLLVTELSIESGHLPLATKHTISAAQAGVDVRGALEDLEKDGTEPPDLQACLSAPRVFVTGGPIAAPNLLVEAAQRKAICALRQAVAESPNLILATALEPGIYVVTVEGRVLSEEWPRRLSGRIRVLDATGERLYMKGFTIRDIDTPGICGAELASRYADVERKILEAERK
jgi:VWFA-related protein